MFKLNNRPMHIFRDFVWESDERTTKLPPKHKSKSHSFFWVHCFQRCTKYWIPAKDINTHILNQKNKINGTENNLFLYYFWCSFLVAHFFHILFLCLFFLYFSLLFGFRTFLIIRAAAATRLLLLLEVVMVVVVQYSSILVQRTISQ